jgi:heat shock protein HtpX
MMRIALFLATNFAILLLVSVVFQLLGIEGFLAENNVDLDLGALLIFCAIFGMSGSLISLLLSKTLAKRSARVQVIEQPRNASERWLVDTVAELSKSAGIQMPEVGVFPSQEANAFATGWNRNAALVAVSEGLLRRFDREEARAVLAHEVGHVANGDMVTLALIQGVLNTFVLFLSRIVGHVVDRVVFKTREGYGPAYWVTVIVTQILLSILATMIVMWFSRWREFRADAAGARLASKSGMIGALKRLQSEHDNSHLPENLMPFGITSGVAHGFKKLFLSHPPLQERIAALHQMP